MPVPTLRRHNDLDLAVRPGGSIGGHSGSGSIVSGTLAGDLQLKKLRPIACASTFA